MTRLEQLNAWIEGKSLCNPEFDECCPDFSCCVPEIKASIEERIAFKNAYLEGKTEIVNFMLTTFLSRMIDYNKLQATVVI